MNLPTDLDRKISACFRQHTAEGYQEGYEELKEIFGERLATFFTFCYCIWDDDGGPKELHIGRNYIKILLTTYSTSFGKNYRYQCTLEVQFFKEQRKIYIGDYSRYQVGNCEFTHDCVVELSRFCEISWHGSQFLFTDSIDSASGLWEDRSDKDIENMKQEAWQRPASDD